MSKLIFLLKSILRATIEWLPPKKQPYLIFDRQSEIDLKEYLPNSYSVLDVRGERINFFVLLLCVLRAQFSLQAYIQQYIRQVQPKIVITYIDNDISFYKLKKIFPQTVFIAVQNGWRLGSETFFRSLAQQQHEETLAADYLFSFGPAIAEKYKKFIEVQAISLGSIKANKQTLAKSCRKKGLLFLSLYTPRFGKDNKILINNAYIGWQHYYQSDIELVRQLHAYCENNNLTLTICGRCSQQAVAEQRFYQQHVGGAIEFIARSSRNANYQLLQDYSVIIGTDTTLVYEALAIGKKTGVFAVRSSLFNDATARFAWPYPVADSGPYWTNVVDYTIYQKIFDFLISCQENEWQQIRKEVLENIMAYDAGNQQLRSKLVIQ